ncbi:MAG: hypothetical protein U9N35_01485 [Euryarchaeota archaeon]|nr:hypothetical protein [Euryarchaeota archaeon]
MNNRSLMNITDAMILMLLGAFLVSFVYASMSELEDTVSTRDTKEQMAEIGSSLANGITEVYLSGKNINAPHVKIVKNVQIPRMIHGHLYAITLTKSYIEVNCPELDYFVRTYLSIDESIIEGKDIWPDEITIVYLKEQETERIELI